MTPIMIRNNGGENAAVYLKFDDGQTHETREGGSTDEGYDYTTVNYRRDGNKIFRIVEREYRDCDGAGSDYREHYCYVNGETDGDGWPEWFEEATRQRDYTAEAAGY